MTFSSRESELADAEARAARAAARAAPAGFVLPTRRRLFAQAAAGTPAKESPSRPSFTQLAVGTVMSELMKHGGLYTLGDSEMTRRRVSGMMMAMGTAPAPAGLAEEMRAVAAAAEQVPTFFFYHLVRNPYKLHSQLVSYLVHPARHLGSPAVAAPPPESFPPHEPRGKTYSRRNIPSAEVPAAATFIGQFIDHDLTLNALNLLSPQGDPAIRDMASPLIDLDSVYGPRLDDTAERTRLIPISGDKFRLRPIGGGECYDVCRELDAPTGAYKALIGDKRNDENQLILQVHIAAMRLHNHFVDTHGAAGADRFRKAKKDTLLHWQAMVATYYLPLVARADAIAAVKQRLFAQVHKVPDAEPLRHRPGLTACGGTTLGMPHEFAIGFRFGHSQLRSEYRLRDGGDPIRLFDPLRVRAPDDLTGDKCLVAEHCIDWAYFTQAAKQPSNLIDTEVNEVVFSLPESTIPDEIKLVTNLPLRNLIRSNDLELCSGEDLAKCYQALYGPALAPVLTADEVEDPQNGDQTPFMLEPDPPTDPDAPAFRTPLWYYLLREAEVHRRASGTPGQPGQLGKVGSLLVAEVILSAIRYARLSVPPAFAGGGAPPPPPSICAGDYDKDPICSIFEDPAWAGEFDAWSPGDQPLKSFLDLVELGLDSEPPECEDDPCA